MDKLEKGAKCVYKKVEQTDKTNEPGQEIPPSCGLGVRHVQSLLVFMCLVSLLMVKAHLGVTIVAMTSDAMTTNANSSNNSPKSMRGQTYRNDLEKIYQYNYNNSKVLDDQHTEPTTEGVADNEYNTLDDGTNVWTGKRTYSWSKATQELVLNSFIFGYVLMAFPMGLCCQRWGGKLPLQVALLVSGFSSIPIPWLALWGGWKAVCCCRILQGVTQAGMMPATHTLLAKWVPPSERGRLACYVYTGSSLGTVIAFQLGGVLAASWGWPSMFWVTGVLCLVVFIVFTTFGAATPTEHKYISDKEKNFILGRIDTGVVKRRKTPWKAIVTSKHVWGVFVSHMGALVSNTFCYIQIPSYVHHVLGVNIKNSGILSSIPFIATCVASSGFGILSDYCTNRKILTIKTARQVFNSISEFGFAACIVAVSFTVNVPLAISLFVASITIHSAMNAGGVLSYIDMAPNYSGVLIATGNTLANLLLLIMPLFVAHIVTDLSDQFQWRIMFCIVAGLAVVGNVSFVALMTADEQPWNNYEYEVKDDEEAKNKLQRTK